VCLILDFALIPSFGAKGASWATTFSYLTATIYLVVVYLKHTETPFKDLFLIRKSDIKELKGLLNR
jgi:Na+-driven multidrug efflux pump